MVIEIPLRDGIAALIDDEDQALIEGWRFHLVPTERLRYARGQRPGHKATYLHRLLLDAPPELEVDHINHDGLDCRRCNLRLVTHQENMRNRRRNENSKSPYVGVRRARSGRWTARIKINGRHLHFGTYDTPEEALRARNSAEASLFGEFAQIQEEAA